MDLHIKITDENGDVLQDLNVYQDGSDSDGATIIASFIERGFSVESKLVPAIKPAHGTRYGVMFVVEQWQEICGWLRESHNLHDYADKIEADLRTMQATDEPLVLKGGINWEARDDQAHETIEANKGLPGEGDPKF